MLRGIVGMLVGIVVIAAVATGCGGSDDDSLTKAEFTKQADAICKQGEEEKSKGLEEAINNPKEKLKSEGEEAEIELLTKYALPPIAEMTEELADLGGPEGQEEKAEAMVKAFEKEISKIEANPKSVTSGSGGEFAEANKLARELELKACGLI